MSYSPQQCYDWFAQGYAWIDDPEQCPCHGSGWGLSNVDTWHCCPIHNTGQLHPYEEEFLHEVKEWWTAEKKKDVFTTPIYSVTETTCTIIQFPSREELEDDCPF